MEIGGKQEILELLPLEVYLFTLMKIKFPFIQRRGVVKLFSNTA